MSMKLEKWCAQGQYRQTDIEMWNELKNLIGQIIENIIHLTKIR